MSTSENSKKITAFGAIPSRHATKRLGDLCALEIRIKFYG